MRAFCWPAFFSLMSPPVLGYAAGVLFGFDRVTPWAAAAPYKPDVLFFLAGMFGAAFSSTGFAVSSRRKFAKRLTVEMWAGKEAAGQRSVLRTFRRTKWFRYYLASLPGVLLNRIRHFRIPLTLDPL